MTKYFLQIHRDPNKEIPFFGTSVFYAECDEKAVKMAIERIASAISLSLNRCTEIATEKDLKL